MSSSNPVTDAITTTQLGNTDTEAKLRNDECDPEDDLSVFLSR